jgi:hypothetical protein
MAGLLTDEEIEVLIRAEIHAFFDSANDFELIRINGSYGSSDQWKLKSQVSPFRALVWHKLSVLVQPMIDASLSGPILKAQIEHWMEDPLVTDDVGNRTRHLALEMSRQMFLNVYKAAAGDAVNQVRSAFQQWNPSSPLSQEMINATARMSGLGPWMSHPDGPEVGWDRSTK